MSLDLAIVMPAYNEEEVIREVVSKWTGLLKKEFHNYDTRLIVVNDGSKDRTGEILKELSAENPLLIAVDQKNGGHGNAVVNAYKKAIELDAKYVFQTDSDDQFETDDLLILWVKRHESKFILGYRKIRYDAPIRLVITRIVRMVLLFVYGTLIKDSNIPFRLIEGGYLKKLLAQLPEPLPFAPNIFLSVMARKSGEKLLNIPVKHKDRQTGEVSIRKMNLLKVCWKSFNELVAFRRSLRSKVKNIKEG